MNLTQEEARQLKKSLPRGYGATIHKKIKKRGIKITPRQVYNIIDGRSPDNHGILNEAVRMAAIEKLRRKKLEERLAKLSK